MLPDGRAICSRRTRVKCAELFNIEGQGAIVTGAGSGLGLAIAEALAESGARVTLLDMDAGRIAAETGRLTALGYAVRGEVVDVCDHAALERALDAAVDHLPAHRVTERREAPGLGGDAAGVHIEQRDARASPPRPGAS